MRRSADILSPIFFRFQIWSVRFSADGKEIVAGASESYEDGKLIGMFPCPIYLTDLSKLPTNQYPIPCLSVYDIEADKPILNIHAHSNDTNSVAWADQASKHVLCSASDDGYVKVWDRRSLSSGKPSGVLVGHTEGITHVASKGTFASRSLGRCTVRCDVMEFRFRSVDIMEIDVVIAFYVRGIGSGDGRTMISNAKDQTIRLWDLRNMAPASTCDEIPNAVERWGTNYDYRFVTLSVFSGLMNF